MNHCRTSCCILALDCETTYEPTMYIASGYSENISIGVSNVYLLRTTLDEEVQLRVCAPGQLVPLNMDSVWEPHYEC